MTQEDRRERKRERPEVVLLGSRPPPGVGGIGGDGVGVMPHRLVNIAPMLSADGGDLLLGAIVGAKHLEEEAAGVGGEICREDRTGDEARDGDQEDAGEPSQATWHASMVPADLMGHKTVEPTQGAPGPRSPPYSIVYVVTGYPRPSPPRSRWTASPNSLGEIEWLRAVRWARLTAKERSAYSGDADSRSFTSRVPCPAATCTSAFQARLLGRT